METPRRALIVDDDPAVCELVQTVLNSTGMEILTLTMGSGATTLLQDQKFSVLLFDLRMPPPDGLDLVRQARRSGFNQMHRSSCSATTRALPPSPKGLRRAPASFCISPSTRDAC
jgi:CheY-like chemotaxis protein